MSAKEKVHQQSRWELVAAFLVGFFVFILAFVLIVWAVSAPTTDPRNDTRPGVTEYTHQPHSA
jgi:hypothetical protein